MYWWLPTELAREGGAGLLGQVPPLGLTLDGTAPDVCSAKACRAAAAELAVAGQREPELRPATRRRGPCRVEFESVEEPGAARGELVTECHLVAVAVVLRVPPGVARDARPDHRVVLSPRHHQEPVEVNARAFLDRS